VFGEIARLRREGRSGALAMIVGLEGSAYRLPGAKLLVREDGPMLGNVSGGCLENDVRERSLAVMKTGRAETVTYDTSGAEDKIWGMGVGCNGAVTLIILPITDEANAAVVDDVRELVRGDSEFGLSVVLEGEGIGGLAVCRDSARKTGTGEGEDGTKVFTEVLVPPPHVIVVGAGDDSIPLVALACEAGFRVTVVDHRRAYVADERFPCALRRLVGRADDGVLELPPPQAVMAVVKLHILAEDKAWVSYFCNAGVKYIGLLGSRSRREEITEGLPPDKKASVYGPVGLDLGAEGPEQVAVSIVSELLAVWSGRAPGHLRDRKKGIHEK